MNKKSKTRIKYSTGLVFRIRKVTFYFCFSDPALTKAGTPTSPLRIHTYETALCIIEER